MRAYMRPINRHIHPLTAPRHECRAGRVLRFSCHELASDGRVLDSDRVGVALAGMKSCVSDIEKLKHSSVAVDYEMRRDAIRRPALLEPSNRPLGSRAFRNMENDRVPLLNRARQRVAQQWLPLCVRVQNWGRIAHKLYDTLFPLPLRV